MGWIRVKGTEYLSSDSGATAIEYGLLAALIGMGMLSGLKTLYGNTDSMWGNMETSVNKEVK